jgi:hypothetical protein
VGLGAWLAKDEQPCLPRPTPAACHPSPHVQGSRPVLLDSLDAPATAKAIHKKGHLGIQSHQPHVAATVIHHHSPKKRDERKIKCTWGVALVAQLALFMDCLSCGGCTQGVQKDGPASLCMCVPVCFPSSPDGGGVRACVCVMQPQFPAGAQQPI